MDTLAAMPPMRASLPALLGGSDWIALLIVGIAAAWLVVRWRRKGLDDDEPGGCASCPASQPPPAEQLDAASPKTARAGDPPAAVRRP